MMENFEFGSTTDLIRYRIQRAFETLEEADYNAKGGYFNTAVKGFTIHVIMLRRH